MDKKGSKGAGCCCGRMALQWWAREVTSSPRPTLHFGFRNPSVGRRRLRRRNLHNPPRTLPFPSHPREFRKRLFHSRPSADEERYPRLAHGTVSRRMTTGRGASLPRAHRSSADACTWHQHAVCNTTALTRGSCGGQSNADLRGPICACHRACGPTAAHHALRTCLLTVSCPVSHSDVVLISTGWVIPPNSSVPRPWAMPVSRYRCVIKNVLMRQCVHGCRLSALPRRSHLLQPERRAMLRLTISCVSSQLASAAPDNREMARLRSAAALLLAAALLVVCSPAAGQGADNAATVPVGAPPTSDEATAPFPSISQSTGAAAAPSPGVTITDAGAVRCSLQSTISPNFELNVRILHSPPAIATCRQGCEIPRSIELALFIVYHAPYLPQTYWG